MITTTLNKNKVKNSLLWSITIPILLGNLAQTIISLTDTAFLGRLGEVELGAAAMAGIYYFCFTTLAWGFAIGEQIIVARRLGEGNFGRIGGVLLHGLMFILPFAMLLYSVLQYGSPYILGSFVSSENIYNVSIEFLSYRSYGIFFACINFMFRSFYIGLSKTRSIGYSTLLMAVVNILLDWMLIFGSPFNEPMGVKGAAIASVCAEVSATIFFFLYTIITKPIIGHRIFKSFVFELEILRSIVKLSIPTMLQKMISYGSWLAFFFIIENMGERPLAITMVVRSAFMLIAMPAFAFGATANTITSRLIGQGRSEDVLSTVWQIIRQGAMLITFFVVLVIIFPRFWLGIYTDSQAIIDGALPILFQMCVTVYTYCLGMALFEAISGTGYTKFALYIETIVLVGYVFVTWLFASYLKWDLFWVWTSEFCYGSSLALLSYFFLKYYKWQKKQV